MQHANRMALIAMMMAAPAWVSTARADAMTRFGPVVDLGSIQSLTTSIFDPYFPQIDANGNLLKSTPGNQGDYHLGANYLSNENPILLNNYLTKGTDPTNLLPASLQSPQASIAGYSSAGDIISNGSGSGLETPFVYSTSTGMFTYLKGLAGQTGAVDVSAINASGQIVGDEGGKAIFWSSPTAVPVALTDLLSSNTGWVLASANSINDRGEIAGVGSAGPNQVNDFLLTPLVTPEPTTMTCIVVVGFGLLARQTIRKFRCSHPTDR